MVDIAPAAGLDAPYWAMTDRLLIDGRPFTLEGRRYQLEIMRPVTDDGKVKTHEVIRKGSQIGITMCKVVEIAHGALHDLYPQGIIYYFPSTKAVEHFSASRFKPFLNDNDSVRKHCNDINAVAIRRIGRTNVNFFGCSATVRVGGEAKDSTTVRSTPADWLLLDERDVFDDEMAKQVNQRLGNSKINRRTDLGTPKLPDDGIDMLYKKSDMRRWQIKCQVCNKHTCMETDFPDCIRIDKNGHGFAACVHCGRPINRSADGIWVPDSPKKTTVGYWPSQLLNPNRDLAHVLLEYADPEEFDMDVATFYNTVLGLPYVNIEDRLRKSDVYACCSNGQMAYSHTGPCAMGVDIQDRFAYVIIGHRVGKNGYNIVKLARVPLDTDLGPLHDIASRFGVRSSVLDAMPATHMARGFRKDNPQFGVNLCYYSEHLKTFDKWDPETGIVSVNRTDIFDASHELVVSPGKLTIPRNCNEVEVFAHQCTCVAKSLEQDKRTGVKVYRYKRLGDNQDHYRNALNYFLLACKRVGVPVTDNLRRREPAGQDMAYSL
ncbi:phage terminase large subunit family protein [Candidatus Pacearchaeota archaeon]|nr:phage terminase large subunit family protein [Candidatus Pacearchaeota archaeon]